VDMGGAARDFRRFTSYSPDEDFSAVTELVGGDALG
jgi:hypothetical protein